MLNSKPRLVVRKVKHHQSEPCSLSSRFNSLVLEIAECREKGCKDMIFQLGLVILELITGQSSDKGGVDLVKWVQECNFPTSSIHKMIDPDLGNSYNGRELNGLLNVARLCIKSFDKPTIYTPQILWYLQKKIGVTRK